MYNRALQATSAFCLFRGQPEAALTFVSLRDGANDDADRFDFFYQL
jgi:hypothetical protein